MTYPNLKAEMARHEVSVVEVAEAACVTPKTVYNWFGGIGKPDIKQAMDIHGRYFPSCELTYLFAE